MSSTCDVQRVPRLIRRKKSSSTSVTTDLPPHIDNNAQLHHVIATTLPLDYDFELPKTIWRIEKSRARHVALQLPEGLLMYASTIGDILIKFAYRYQLPQVTVDDAQPTEIESLSVLGDVTYGACCIDDLSARALGCDLLVHYGHSCLVPLKCTVIPCLYVFVEIRVDVQHLLDCLRMTFQQEATETSTQDCKLIQILLMGTVQFRSAVLEAAKRINNDEQYPSSTSLETPENNHPVRLEAVVPQAKPLSPGEVLGCTAPSGLKKLDWHQAISSVRQRHARKTTGLHSDSINVGETIRSHSMSSTSIASERVMIFIADGRFHLEAAMIANPTLRALRYDPYSKSLTEERYEILQMKKLRSDAILSTRKILGIFSSSLRYTKDNSGTFETAKATSESIAASVLQLNFPSVSLSPSQSSTPKIMGIILGTLGRQGNPAILSRIRSLLRSHGIRSIVVLLSEIMPKKLEMLSISAPQGNGVCAFVQIACPRLSIDWGHHFCVPVLSPFELFVALGEVAEPSLWSPSDRKNQQVIEGDDQDGGYPMDFYGNDGGPWTNYYGSNKDRQLLHV